MEKEQALYYVERNPDKAGGIATFSRYTQRLIDAGQALKNFLLSGHF
ncbi:hypothetical protein [Spirosoma panaciterrae]|nr:hypothetical protein [Spirosoma panaciterrae]